MTNHSTDPKLSVATSHKKGDHHDSQDQLSEADRKKALDRQHKIMALLKEFISYFDHSMVHAPALKEVHDRATQLMEDLHLDPPGLRTWEAVTIFVIHTAHDLEKIPSSEWHHLHSSLRQVDKALEGSTVSASEVDVPSDLDSMLMEWALQRLRALKQPMITIIYELTSFYEKNKYLGSRIIRSFSHISTKLLTIHISVMHADLLKFLQLMVELKGQHKPVKFVFSSHLLENMMPMLGWIKSQLFAHPTTPFRFYYTGNGKSLSHYPDLYDVCTGVDVQFSDHTPIDHVLQLISDSKKNSFTTLEELRLHDGPDDSSRLTVSLPTSLKRVMLVAVKLPSLWVATLSLPHLSNLVIDGVPFTGTLEELSAIVASRHWKTLSLSHNGLTNEVVNKLLEIKMRHEHTLQDYAASATHAAATHLTILRLRENKLTAKPPLQFRSCSHLRHLNVSGNRDLGHGLDVKYLPATLKVLLAAKCGIHIARPKKGQPAPATHDRLDIRRHLPELQFLDLSENEVTYLGAYLAPKKLHTLYVVQCGLIEIASGLKDSSIRELDFSHNTSLGATLNAEHLPVTLEELFAVDCGITIPKASGFRHTLKTKISNHGQTSGSSQRNLEPHERFDFRTNCPKLTTLDLTRNSISHLGEDMFPHSLRTLHIDANSKCSKDESRHYKLSHEATVRRKSIKAFDDPDYFMQ